jgi:hypothetical protein
MRKGEVAEVAEVADKRECKVADKHECRQCHTHKDIEDFDLRGASRDKSITGWRRESVCRACEAKQDAEFKQCDKCKKVKPRAEYQRHNVKMRFPADFKYCKACEFPKCEGCGRQPEERINVKKDSVKGPWYMSGRTKTTTLDLRHPDLRPVDCPRP